MLIVAIIVVNWQYKDNYHHPHSTAAETLTQGTTGNTKITIVILIQQQLKHPGNHRRIDLVLNVAVQFVSVRKLCPLGARWTYGHQTGSLKEVNFVCRDGVLCSGSATKTQDLFDPFIIFANAFLRREPAKKEAPSDRSSSDGNQF